MFTSKELKLIKDSVSISLKCNQSFIRAYTDTLKEIADNEKQFVTKEITRLNSEIVTMLNIISITNQILNTNKDIA